MTPRPLISALAVALVVALAAPPADAQRRRAAAKPKAPAVPAACTDFYAHANADWLKVNTLLPGVSATSALEQLADRAHQQEIDLLNAAMMAPRNDVEKLLGDFWASGIDEASVERDGANPIAPLLTRIGAIRRSKDVPAAIAALHQVGIPVAFTFSADVDLRDLSRHIGYFGQGGIGLADPAFYNRTDAETRALMGQYDAYVRKILTLAGTPADKVAAEAQLVIDLETRLARLARPLADLREPTRNYAPVPVADLAKRYKRLQLADFLKAQGVNDDTVSMANPELFAQLDALVGSLKPAQWQAFLRWRVGDTMAPYLSRTWRDTHFDFRGRLMRGDDAIAPRQQQVIDAINRAAGPMLGREYVSRYLTAAQRSRAEEIATRVRAALGESLARDPRLGPAAKAEAQAKLQALKIEIGAPRRDLDYTVQPMGRGSFGGNMLIASTWRHREEMRRIGRGNADRRWDVLPQQPALTYDVAQNRLIVTAAILQPPVLDLSKPLAAQYGAFGGLVGHELSHGFDAVGRRVDAKGDVRDWWGPSESAAWDTLRNRIGAQYASYPYPGLTGIRVDGTRVRDIAIADHAGVELAQAALRAAQPAPDKAAQQDFYRGWAQLWAQSTSPEAATQRAATGAHPPGQWRANGPLIQQAAFGEAFGCKAGTAMQAKPADRIQLWP